MQIGLIAGAGQLPKIIVEDAKERGYSVVTVALENLASSELNAISDVIAWVNPGRFGDMLRALKESHVSEVIMAGKVPKSLLYKSKVTPDLRAMKILFSLKERGDDAILRAITDELEKEGIRVIDTTAFSPHLLAERGVMTKNNPSKDEWKDIAFGWKIVKDISRMDIGQTVVVKEKAVMAVEAIEGTDEAILRGGKWGGAGVVVVKVSKPHQDMRLDVPVAGLMTIKAMDDVRARVLAVEAEKCILVDKRSLVRYAEERGISIVGISAEDFSSKKAAVST